MSVASVATCYRWIKLVDLSLCTLEDVRFIDTGGTNGWVANPLPEWVDGFITSLVLGGVILSVDLRMLPPGQGIPPHRDSKVYASPQVIERRFHVPLVTHPNVIMRWPEDGVETHLAVGGLYEVDFTKTHEIVHRAAINRVHLQIHTANATIEVGP